MTTRPRVQQLHQSGATNGQVATWDNAAGMWVPATPSGSSAPVTTKGDLYGYDTAGNRIPVGSDGQVLTADSTQTLGLKWAAPPPVPTHASDLATAYAPLTTDIGGVPEFVWDANNNLVLTEVSIP